MLRPCGPRNDVIARRPKADEAISFSVLCPLSSETTGFTLVEMMVAVCVLAIGITLVSRSFINTVSVMDTMQNRIAAAYFLGARMNGIEEAALNKDGLKIGDLSEETTINGRGAVFTSEITPLEEEGFEDINQVKLTLSWKEGAVGKDAVLVTYLPNRK